jgi:hypothetical protein
MDALRAGSWNAERALSDMMSALYRGGRTCPPTAYGRRQRPWRPNSPLRTQAMNARHFSGVY